jgi:signal transduction histidine kinase
VIGETGYSTPIALDRDLFMRRLIAGIGHLNEGILGSDVAGAELSDAARLRTGKLAANLKRLDLRVIVEDAVDRERELFDQGSRYRLEVRQPTKPVPVSVDRARIEWVVTNLIENAIKYSPAGGSITITTDTADASARIIVTDQGIGIPDAGLAKLGTPFFRGSNASARNFNGLGLGLHLSQAIVEAHGGEVTFNSKEGAGTTVIVFLPQADIESR